MILIALVFAGQNKKGYITSFHFLFNGLIPHIPKNVYSDINEIYEFK